jgi:DNA polymerase III epsilon subunit-like protein
MTGTFKTKTRVYTSPEFFTPITGRKSFTDAAIDFRRGLIENSSMAVLNADLSVKAAMGAGLSASASSIGQSSQGTSPNTDGKKRVNKGGVPGMVEDERGFRYMPDATWGPDKVLKLFPSPEERQSSNKVPNFGFVDREPIFTPQQFVEQMEKKPKIRMSKYKINTRTGEPIEDTEVEFDRMRFGKTFKVNPDISNEIEEDISDETSGEMQEKSLGSTLKQRMPGATIAGRAAARFGVIMDELGKMRCPPGTPAANQFTDMTGSNCFGITPGNMISEAINLAQRLIPSDDSRRTDGFTRGVANFFFDMENGIFGNNVWYHPDGTRMKHGEWRKFREANGVARNERWMVNGVERVYAEIDAQEARLTDLYQKLDIDTRDSRKATNEHLYEAFEKLEQSGVITAKIEGRPTEADVEAMMTSRLKNTDAHWNTRSNEEKALFLKIEIQRYRELERAHLEAFLDEVIKNPEHMKSIRAVRMHPTGKDRASYGIDGIDRRTNMPYGSINIDIPKSMEFEDSLLPALSPDERLRIWAEGGMSEALRSSTVKDFLVNSNAYAGQMIAMVDGGRGLGRHDMKHEIAHSIQAAAIFEHMKRELDARGSLVMNTKNGPKTITSVAELDNDMLAALMINENYMGIDLDSLKSLRSRGDIVALLGGKYIDDVDNQYDGKRRAAEIGAEIWALRSAGLIFGDDVDAALEYMDDVASGKITADRTVADSVLTRRVYDDHLDGTRRVREAREAREAAEEAARLAESADTPDEEFFDADTRAAEDRMSDAREAYALEKRAEVKTTKEQAKTMTEEEMIDFLSYSTEGSDALTEMLDAAGEAGEEPDWMSVMDRDTLDAQSKSVIDEWVKRFTVRRSPEALEKLLNMVDDKRESRGTLSPEKIEERRHREYLEGATERAKDLDLEDLVEFSSNWEELASSEGIEAPERTRRKEARDMYRDEYIKRRTEGPDSFSREDARKEFNAKLKELRKPKTTAERKKRDRVKPKKFNSHKGKDGAHTFATQERARLLEGATTAEKIAFVEMGSGETDVINMMAGHSEGMASARAIQRRNTRLKKNGILPDGLNQHEASVEEQVENFYIPLLELMDKSSLSQMVEMHLDGNEDSGLYIEDLLSGNAPEFTMGIGTGTLVTNKTDFSDGKKIVIRVPAGSRALLPDWSYRSDSDDGEQKIMIPPSKLHLVEIRDDGTVVLEVGEQMGTEATLKTAIEEIGPGNGGAGDVAYRTGLQKKLNKVVDKRITERRRQGMFDPDSKSPIEEERFSTTADTAATGAGFMPDRPPSAPSRATTDRGDIGTGDYDDDLSPAERRFQREERNRRRGNPRLSSGADTEKLVSISGPQDARRVIDSNLPASVRTEKEAYTILTELAKMAREAKAKGKDAPNYDFCKVSIPGTNLFCGDSKGIPRKKMPQFSGKPTPGSPADSRPKDKDGGVDGTQDFIKHMEGLGVKVEEKEVLASTLRASQNELVGEKVAGMMTNENFDPAGEPIFVSRDGYVIDGHHRWAAQVGRDLEDGNLGDLPLNVKVVDMDILEVLEEANKFAQEFGIAPKTAGNDAAQNRLSSGAKWGQMPSNNQQLARLLEPSNNDGFNEIYGPPQTRQERITQMAEMQSEVMTSLREMFDNVPGAGDSLGLDLNHIDPYLVDFIKNSSDEEIYELISQSAKNLHESFDARPRVRMRQDELDGFAASGRYGREKSFNNERFSSGLVKKGIKARAKERAIEIIADRIGMDEDSREVAEMVFNTASALKYGPEAALTRLAIDLGRRGSRELAEKTVEELVKRGKITDEQAKSILSKLDKVAPEGLPEPLKRGVGRAARATADAIDTPENRERLENAREAVGEAAGRAREAVGEGARNIAERGRERLRKLRERDDAGSLPSAPEDVPFGDFDPADAPVGRLASGRRLDRRVSGSDNGRERIMEGANVTRTRLSSGETPKIDKPKKPSRPRDPDNGPMTGKFIDIFRGVKSYQEMLDRYNEQEVIFFDYETTGFSPTDDRPVQIGAVKMKGGKVVERFNVFVNPEKELSDWSKENLLNADGKPLTNDWLSGQSSVNEGHQQLIDFFGPDALLGGQYTPFDLGFLEESLKNAGIEWTPAGVIDSKALADELLPRWTADGGDGPFALNPDGTKYATNSLGPLSDYLEVELTAWHTADADSEASAMIVQKILERAAEREDTPKHLLDVDNLPSVVAERRARHKLDMDKYFADLKQYKVDNEAYEASQTGERLSSGATMDDKLGKTVGIDELLADPTMAEELRKRSADIKALSDRERAQRFTDPNDPDSIYVIHFGASQLEGGQIDPARSRGQVGSNVPAAGNTRLVNDQTARYMVGLRNTARRDLSILEEIKRQMETDGVVDFEAIARTDPKDSMRAGRAKILLGVKRTDRDYERSTFTPPYWNPENFDAQIASENRTLSSLDKVADQLIADDYQYTSTYRASGLRDLRSSYGGRYAEGGSTEWGDNSPRSSTTGIHILKVKVGDNAIEQNSVGETHLVGKHTPVASLVVRADDYDDNPANDTWTGWMDMAIEADIKKGSGERLSSGATGRSPGLKTNRDRPMSEYGMDWKPEYSDKEWVKPAKNWEGWDDVPVTEVDLSSEIRPTESHLKGSSIDKVVSGEEAFRDGYHPNVIIDTDGKMYVSDGHNRVAMHRALGNEKMTARVIDLRTQDAPWGDKTPNTAETRLSSGEGPRSGKPKRAKMYKGYTLNEPANPTPKPGEYPDDVVEAATKQRAKIAEVEAEITKLLIDLADKNKAQMEGLDFRMKALNSLMRKIAAEKDSEHGGDAQKAAEAMSDVVRYTMSYEPDDYVAGVKDVIAQMQKLGYDLRVKNYWEADDPYQGINVAAIHPNGTKFELQFHTPQSVADKEKIHAIYEDYRTEKDYLKRLVMYRKMVNLANKIGVPIPPDELMKIGIIKTQPFTPR